MSAKDSLRNVWFIQANTDESGSVLNQKALRLHLNNVESGNKFQNVLENVIMDEMDDEEREILLEGFKKIAQRNDYVEKGEIEMFLLGSKMEKLTAKMRTNEIMKV